MKNHVIRQLVYKLMGRSRLAMVVAALAIAAVGYLTSEQGRQGRDRSSPGGAAPERVSGFANLTDGDSFRLGKHKVRMVGIDAPEGLQECRKDGKVWRCGEEARRQLKRRIGGGKIDCDVQERDQYGRLLATCSLRGENLNAWMVENGWAVSFGRSYNREERKAKQARLGIWKSEFQRPQDWRRVNNK